MVRALRWIESIGPLLPPGALARGRRSARRIPPPPNALGPSNVPQPDTYYRWRQGYGGLKTEQIRRLKQLETENARLRRAIADLTLDKLILKEAAKGNW